MKKSKLLILGVIGLLLTTGLILIGCDFKLCPDVGKCKWKVYFIDSRNYISLYKTDCGSEKCYVNKAKPLQAPAGDEMELTCDNRCGE